MAFALVHPALRLETIYEESECIHGSIFNDEQDVYIPEVDSYLITRDAFERMVQARQDGEIEFARSLAENLIQVAKNIDCVPHALVAYAHELLATTGPPGFLDVEHARLAYEHLRHDILRDSCEERRAWRWQRLEKLRQIVITAEREEGPWNSPKGKKRRGVIDPQLNFDMDEDLMEDDKDMYDEDCAEADDASSIYSQKGLNRKDSVLETGLEDGWKGDNDISGPTPIVHGNESIGSSFWSQSDATTLLDDTGAFEDTEDISGYLDGLLSECRTDRAQILGQVQTHGRQKHNDPPEWMIQSCVEKWVTTNPTHFPKDPNKTSAEIHLDRLLEELRAAKQREIDRVEGEPESISDDQPVIGDSPFFVNGVLRVPFPIIAKQPPVVEIRPSSEESSAVELVPAEKKSFRSLIPRWNPRHEGQGGSKKTSKTSKATTGSPESNRSQGSLETHNNIDVSRDPKAFRSSIPVPTRLLPKVTNAGTTTKAKGPRSRNLAFKPSRPELKQDKNETSAKTDGAKSRSLASKLSRPDLKKRKETVKTKVATSVGLASKLTSSGQDSNPVKGKQPLEDAVSGFKTLASEVGSRRLKEESSEEQSRLRTLLPKLSKRNVKADCHKAAQANASTSRRLATKPSKRKLSERRTQISKADDATLKSLVPKMSSKYVGQGCRAELSKADREVLRMDLISESAYALA